MKSIFQYASLAVLIVMIGGGAAYLLCLAMSPSVEVVESKGSAERVEAKAKKVVAVAPRSERRIETKMAVAQPIQPAANVVLMPPPPANDDIDESELNAQQRAVMNELQAALDAEDLSGVRRAIAKFVLKTSAGGLEGQAPKCMRLRAVEALGWFGKAAAVDLIACMADGDPEVSSESTSQFELALQDPDMPATERAQNLTGVMKAMVDADTVDSLLSNLNELPNSLRASAVETILTTGSQTAQKVMTEQLELYLDDEVKSVEDIARWKAENPDN